MTTPAAVRTRAVPRTDIRGWKKVWYAARALVLWTVSILHFGVLASVLVLLAIFVDPRKNDRPQRWLFRNVLRLAGVRFEVRRAPGFDPQRTSLFVCNHVNLFDAFVVYSAIPQFVRGLELESHFKIPAYGWMMKRFGNIPVPKQPTAADLKRMYQRVRRALDDGISIIVFPEGGRTLDGRVGPFREGAFRMAQQFGYPLVPMSIVGSFEFNRKGDWILYPSKITVYLHDTIETRGLRKEEIPALVERVHGIISAPVEAHMGLRRQPARQRFWWEQPATAQPQD
ncbi:MAG: 1-acyl-sn-glycerol-3-phosphate acyltransferase [Acidobacteriia bacterium]|jgi:1-acyl-sn-glycerol-3-phosphate acyltransferase|nr:1-acyl-sn-glycerol-3-phosphate acyltransferase [Terriglobia bacterium]